MCAMGGWLKRISQTVRTKLDRSRGDGYNWPGPLQNNTILGPDAVLGNPSVLVAKTVLLRTVARMSAKFASVLYDDVHFLKLGNVFSTIRTTITAH